MVMKEKKHDESLKWYISILQVLDIIFIVRSNGSKLFTKHYKFTWAYFLLVFFDRNQVPYCLLDHLLEQQETIMYKNLRWQIYQAFHLEMLMIGWDGWITFPQVNRKVTAKYTSHWSQ